ncbi:MAG TPA: glycosyltransferase family 2 protein [Candidatus Limnocylindria bacterium]|nr:glycosyltransferase family 2 protein [Candidatus Limnocylindria bacterium]
MARTASLTGGQRRVQRVLEVAPGALTWTILIAPVVASFIFAPYIAAAIFVIDIYWFIRTGTVVFGIRRTYRQMKREMQEDWWQRCLALAVGPGSLDPRRVVHAVLIPTYTEPYEILRETVRAIADADYPAENKVVAIITRETDRPGWENVRRLQEEFGGRLRAFFHIKDPLLPGIVVGKSAAMAYGGPVLRRELDAMGLDPRVVIVTDLDSDFRVHRRYFAYVTHHYAQDPKRLDCVFQPIPMFHNNLWRVPFAVRIMASACTQWQMFLSSRPDRLVAFSSYSMSLDLVIRADYWDADVIPEDSRFYWKSFFATSGQLKMVPVFLPIYGDAPEASDRGLPWERVKTHANQYNQIKRWAWGVSDIPYVTVRLLRHSEIPLWLRARRYGYMVFNHLTWTTLPVLLLFGAALPRLLQEDWNLATAADRLALYAFILINIAFLNIAALILVERRINPPMPRGWGFFHQMWAYLQLGLYPIVGLLFSVLPALEAQTRLMLGMYLEYKVTEKVAEGPVQGTA